MNFEKPPIYFDIETGPLPRDEVEKFIPKFEAPSNYKDADKIAEFVSKKEEAWFKKAALSCTTGKVLAIGFCSNKDDVSILEGDEITILTSFWNAITYHGAFLQKLVGFNSNEFVRSTKVFRAEISLAKQRSNAKKPPESARIPPLENI